MKKAVIAAVIACMMITPVYADEKDDKIAELEAQVQEMQTTIDDLTEQLEKYTKGSSQEFYAIGDTWTVPGQWKVTIDGVEETTERNEFADTNPAAVYIVSYTYENIGYDSDFTNGLYIDFTDGIVDSAGKMGYSYPGNIISYPQETPVGATCKAQSCIGVDNAGSFTINFSAYDSTDANQKAVFHIDVK